MLSIPDDELTDVSIHASAWEATSLTLSANA